MNMQFGKIEQPGTSPQVSTVIAMTDALFGKPGAIRAVPAHKPSPEEEFDICLALARNLQNKVLALRNGFKGNRSADHLKDDLQSAENFIGGAVRKLQAAADEFADGAPDAEESCHCYVCDNCDAARSDEHYDRKRDGRL